MELVVHHEGLLYLCYSGASSLCNGVLYGIIDNSTPISSHSELLSPHLLPSIYVTVDTVSVQVTSMRFLKLKRTQGCKEEEEDEFNTARRGIRDAALRDSRLLLPSDLIQLHQDKTLQKVQLQIEEEDRMDNPDHDSELLTFHSAIDSETDIDLDLERTEDTCTSGSTNNSNSQSTEETYSVTTTRSVRFDKAIYHVHPICMGDNPSCMEGPPISIAWQASHTTTVDLSSNHSADDNGNSSPQSTSSSSHHQQPPRRSLVQLHLTSLDRDMALRYQGGYSRAEIRKRTKPIKVIQRQRRNTIARMRLQPIQQAWEKVTRWWQRTTLSRDEREWRQTCKEWTLRAYSKQQQQQPPPPKAKARGILRRTSIPNNPVPFSSMIQKQTSHDATADFTSDPSSQLSLTVL